MDEFNSIMIEWPRGGKNVFLQLDKKDPNNIAAIEESGQKITYGELVENISHIRGIIPERSIVFLMCKNVIGALSAYISMVENKIVPVTLSESIDKELFNTLLETYRPQFICTETKNIKEYKFKEVFEDKEFTYLSTNYEKYPINDKLELLMTTSGSTGSPKLVRYKKGNLEANAKNVAAAWGWTSNERPICDLLINYTMGLNVINTHLYVGATLLLITSNITEKKYWDFIKANRATNFTGVPFSYDLLWKLKFFRMDLPHLTTLSEGGGKLTDQMFIKVAKFAQENDKRFIASFGTTETSARLSMLTPDMAIEKKGSIGKAIPEGELVLFDDDGNEIEQIEAEGELGYKGPNVTMGYAYAIEDLMLDDEFNGVYKTGDIARRDKDGFYFIVGRKSRFLKMLGHRVSLDQSERLIKEKFNIDCACGGTDEQMEIYVTEMEDTDIIKRFISEKTGIYSTMFKVMQVREIPRNSTGKILYKKLVL